MKADNDNRSAAFRSLDALPLFATDKEIAIAVVGRSNAENWRRNVLPILEGRSFPRIDALHGGRPVALVQQYYQAYLGIADAGVSTGADVKEDDEAWSTSRRVLRSKRRA